GRSGSAGLFASPISAVERLSQRRIDMMRAQSPAACSIASRIEGADLASPIAPQRDFGAPVSQRDQVGRRRSELWSSSVLRPVGISDAGRYRLFALKRAA